MIDYHFGHFLLNYLNKPIEDINITNNSCLGIDVSVGVCLVATKCTFWLPLVIKNILHKIKNRKLYFFGSKESVYFIREIIQYDISYYVINDIKHISQYNTLLLNKNFWETFKENYILVTQPDCILLRDLKMSDLQFDYIGAVCGYWDERYIINGGLSIRNKNTMITICDNLSDEDKNGNIPEDIIFTNIIKKNKSYKCPNITDCDNFSVESTGCIHQAIGIHGTDKYYINQSIKTEFINKFL